MVPHAVDILETLVLDDSSPGLFVALQRDADFPRFGEHFRIGHRRFIQQRVRSSQRASPYHYQFLYANNAGHVDANALCAWHCAFSFSTVLSTLPAKLQILVSLNLSLEKIAAEKG